MMHCADVILVRMRDHEPDQIGLALDDEGRIRHHDLDPRYRVVAEGHAEIDHQPLAGIAVEVEVHADLAGAAERHEQQLVRLPHRSAELVLAHARLRSWISSRPRSVISPSTVVIALVAPANSGARPPVAITGSSKSASARMRETIPSISPI